MWRCSTTWNILIKCGRCAGWGRIFWKVWIPHPDGHAGEAHAAAPGPQPGGGHLPGGGTPVGPQPRAGCGRLPGLPAEEGEEKYTLLTPELTRKPYFVDAQAQRGRIYHYYVTAVDDSPRANESLPSEDADNLLAVSVRLAAKTFMGVARPTCRAGGARHDSFLLIPQLRLGNRY